MSNIKLYDDNESVCCKKVRLAMAEKGVAYERIEVELKKGEEHKEEFRKINPKGLVPVLVHNDHIIPESTAINEYIDETFEGPALMPVDTYERLQVRLITKHMDEEMHPPKTASMTFSIAFRELWLSHMPSKKEQDEYLEKISNPTTRAVLKDSIEFGLEAPTFRESLIAFNKLLDEMEKTLSKSHWMVGNKFTLADLALSPWIFRMEELQLSPMWEGSPGVLAWLERNKARPGWKEAVLDYHEAEYVELMLQKGKESWPTVEKILIDEGLLT